MSLIETIKQYHRYGLVITPLRGKVPVLKNWQSQNQLNIEEFKDILSAGFVIPKNFLVIDVDNHNDNQGTLSLKKMSENFGFNFEANAKVKIRTANGGLHLYYKLDRDATIPNGLMGYASIEFKHTGRQVVIPESVLENGKKYEFDILSDDDFSALNLLPENFLRELVKQPKTPVKTNSKIPPKDLEADVEYFKTILNEYPEIKSGQRNDVMYKLACVGRERALSPEKTLSILIEFNAEKIQPKLGKHEVSHCVKSAFKYAKGDNHSVSIFENSEETEQPVDLSPEVHANLWKESLITDKNGIPSRTKFATHNTQLFLTHMPMFKDKIAVNLFSMDTIWKTPAPWHKALTTECDRVLDDDDLIRIRESLNEVGYDPTPTHILEACRAVSLRNEWHPVKDYLEELPEWDGKERLKLFFPEYCGAEHNAYTEEIGVKIFTALVARVYNPGCKFDYLPILIGGEGIGKSTLLKDIAIKDRWFTDNLGSIENKDVILRMRSKWVVENAEMTSFNRTDPQEVKAFLSRCVDRDRLPYDRLPRDLPRQCVIFGTTNKDRFLQSETGNRRMWPIEVIKINRAKVKQDLPHFYAEAIYRFKNHEELTLTNPEAIAIAKQIQDDRYNEDDWQEFILRFLDENKADKTSILKIWEECFGKDPAHLGVKEQSRIGKILRRMGWVRKTVRVGDKSVSGFMKKS
ncbi:COG5545 Predicted P-loop ATPase and inactivated derivatives [uncultured Caudovirales phage]|uniref:COG5545 Predicted P-loop ATPase and inactivated derivatives n=1 Tax=uncultured Caudovirales phage TaxID=2100421 RepID=A0A6J5NZT1_9CAUD|nr:COG5545 Predicted P-loop ATPase and inactivated derivatives [uncultured Caudovirales phage]